MDISVAQHAAPVVHHAAPVIKTVLVGVSEMTAAIYSGIAFFFGIVLGAYVRGRGLTGVEIDLANVKNDIVALKNRIDPPVVVTPVSTPVVVTTA